MTAQTRILLIEDNEDLAVLLRLHFSDAGMDLVWRADGSSGLSTALAEHFALIILDLILPAINGIELCRIIRERDEQVPILILTSRSTERDRVHGLDVGADDYLTKPFGIRELMARVRAILRRRDKMERQGFEAGGTLERDELVIMIAERRVFVSGKPVELTSKEFDLLVNFAEHPGRVFTRNQLLDRVWGYSHDGYEHTVNSHINRLRGKIEIDRKHPKFIQTVWGVGYRFRCSQPA